MGTGGFGGLVGPWLLGACLCCFSRGAFPLCVLCCASPLARLSLASPVVGRCLRSLFAPAELRSPPPCQPADVFALSPPLCRKAGQGSLGRHLRCSHRVCHLSLGCWSPLVHSHHRRLLSSLLFSPFHSAVVKINVSPPFLCLLSNPHPLPTHTFALYMAVRDMVGTACIFCMLLSNGKKSVCV